MEKIDILVIGGSAAGIVAAVTGKSRYSDKSSLIDRVLWKNSIHHARPME